MIVVLMGVSGSGKTTIGVLLAHEADAEFADADDYHPAANKEKMAAGHPLDDVDREPWLKALNGLLRTWFDQKKNAVLACSALKESYRDTLSTGMPENTVTFCLLEVPRELLQKRLAERHHEFMPSTLLDSQIETLEAPKNGFIVQNDQAPSEVVAEILERIKEQQNARRRSEHELFV